MQISRNDLSSLGDSEGKESACHAGDLGSVPGLGRSPGEGDSYSLQYSGLENSMDYRVHGVAESDTTEQFSLSFMVFQGRWYKMVTKSTGRL